MKRRPSFVFCVLGLCAWMTACSDELGECDMAAAESLVFGRSLLAATAGQALAHDSCGQGAFCHSQRAQGLNRVGAPHGLDFDMIPDPTGWNTLREHAEDAWAAVDEGEMPPRGAGSSKVGDGDWRFDRARRAGSRPLPSIYSAEGKAIFRNWLACDAPFVAETTLVEPDAGMPVEPNDEDGGEQLIPVDWDTVYADIVQPNCALGGCHDGASRAGGLPMTDKCAAFDALGQAGPCGRPRVVPGDSSSLLLDKLQHEMPTCGFRMPVTGSLPAAQIARVAEWIEAGAHSTACE